MFKPVLNTSHENIRTIVESAGAILVSVDDTVSDSVLIQAGKSQKELPVTLFANPDFASVVIRDAMLYLRETTPDEFIRRDIANFISMVTGVASAIAFASLGVVIVYLMGVL
jgi:hypothetical protein